DQAPARKTQLHEGDVQRLVVVPMLIWALLLTMVESMIADVRVPLIAVTSVAGIVAAATLALCGGVVIAYREAHPETRGGDARIAAGIVLIALASGGTAAAWAALVPSWVFAHLP